MYRRAIQVATLVLASTLIGAPRALATDDSTLGGGRAGVVDLERPPGTVALGLDLLIEGAWKQEGLQPNPPCSAEEYVRRVYLDVVGTIPTALQVREFVRDDRPDKRALLVDRLLASPGYARHFANLWGKVLIGQDTGVNNREFVPSLFQDWLEQQFRRDRPYAEIVTELLTATNTVYRNPPLSFQGRRDHSPADLAGATSKAFLGVQIQCAQCHDHPYETITQKDFQGFAAFFARTLRQREKIPYELFGAQAQARAERNYEQTVERLMENGATEEVARAQAERRRPSSAKLTDLDGGRPVPRGLMRRAEQRFGDIAKEPPKFLGDDVYEDVAGDNRRGALARWIVSTENPYTAKALVNRYWGWFLGRGFVHPVDDFSSVNIPSVPAALDLLARDAAEHEYDLKRLIRIITATRAYQLSTASPDRSDLAVEFFAAGPLKEFTPQQTFDALQVALGVVENGTEMSSVGAGAPSAMDMGGYGMMDAADPASRSVAQRRLQQAARAFFQTFDDDEQNEAEAFTGTIPQGLFLLNSPVINTLLVEPRVSVVPEIVAAFDSEAERIRHLYLRTLAREPTPAELRRMVQFVRSAEPVTEAPQPAETDRKKKKKRDARPRRRTAESRRHAAYADVLWALLSTSEFATNH